MVSPPPPPDASHTLPDALKKQLAGFRRQLWQRKISEMLAVAFIGLLTSFLVVYALDRYFQTPSWLRLVILIAAILLLGGVVPYGLYRWVWRRRFDQQLAQLIAQRFPDLGDRLLGVIELQSQRGRDDTFSQRLREAAMAAVSDEVVKRDLSVALPPPRHRIGLGLSLVLASLVAGAYLISPLASYNALNRWLFPFSSIERYTFTRLDHQPTTLSVVYGEPFEIRLHLAANSEQRPSHGHARLGSQPAIVSALEKDHYVFKFPGQQERHQVIFRIGDLVHVMVVEPMARPSLESMLATIRYPSYLQIPSLTTGFKSGNLNILAGSQVSLQFNSDRPFASAKFGEMTKCMDATNSAGTSVKIPPPSIEIDGKIAKSSPFTIEKDSLEIPLSWRDTKGLEGASQFSIRLSALADEMPNTYLQGIDRQKVMLPDETVDFELLAEDDYGIKEVGIEWSGQLTRPSANSPAQGELKITDGSASIKRSLMPAAFSPTALGITPQKIILRGYSQDFNPQRGRSYSEPVILFVMSRDEHVQLIKSKFDRIISELEDLHRREIGLLDENTQLSRRADDKATTEQDVERLSRQEQAEAESSRRMSDIHARMEELMKDAIRNGEVDKLSLQRMAESLKPIQELAQKDIPALLEQLHSTQAPTNSPSKTQQDLANMVDDQKSIIQKMQEAIEKVNEANSRLEAGTFVNRLKKAATEQDGVATHLIQAYPKLLGKRPAKLDPSVSKNLQQTAQLQSNTASDIRWLQEDLASYHLRSNNASFKKLLDLMSASQIDVGLDKIREMLAINHSFLATEEAKKWALQLAKWAESLSTNPNSSAGGGGGGGVNPQDEDFEFMLRVMKLMQTEQDLRSQTRVLEQLRRKEN